MRLQDKVCLITGGGSGIGRATAKHIAREGARVVIADWNVEAGAAVVGEIAQAGGVALFVHTDVAQASDCAAMVAAAVKEYGQLDVLFANAGVEMWQQDGYAHDTPEAVWDRIHSINLRGLWLSCKYAAQQMLARAAGRSSSPARPPALPAARQTRSPTVPAKAG